MTGPDDELYSASLMAKGDTLHQLGASDSSREREAVAVWKALAADPSIPLRRRNQALCKAGDVLHALGDDDGALDCYRTAFLNPRSPEPEQLWHDRAAFQAARLLEARQQWRDAVALYDSLVSEGGARASEAKARLSKLRLENFLWEN